MIKFFINLPGKRLKKALFMELYRKFKTRSLHKNNSGYNYTREYNLSAIATSRSSGIVDVSSPIATYLPTAAL